ncbi:MAG: FHA domain-containing protein [Bacteriovoracaceae bacterium]
MHLILKVRSTQKETTYKLELNTSVVIGRGAKAEFTIADERVSGIHCNLTFKKDGLEINDLGSKNGTYLNGIKIEKAEVFLGDIIKIGDSLITIEENLLSDEMKEFLSFPGPGGNRVEYSLKADFTGARVSNQLNDKRSYQTRAIEIELRRKAKTKIKLSKDEIKQKFKALTALSLIFDSILLFILLAFPFVNHHWFNYFSAHFGTQKIVLIAGLDLILLITYWLVNFKLLKFSLGEFFSGLHWLYQRQ